MSRFFKYILRNHFSRNNLDFLIFFVTYRCQSRCRSCFFADKMRGRRELGMSEIKKLAPTIGSFHTLLYSGGEPFLRGDLPRITRTLIKTNGVRNVSIPTNGLSGGRMYGALREMLARHPAINFSVNFSIDGPQQIHDHIRNVRDAYRRVRRALRKVLALKKHYPNLSVTVNTVVCAENIEELPAFMDGIWNDFNLDDHLFDLLRGISRDESMSLPSLSKIKRVHRKITANRKRYLFKRQRISVIDGVAALALERYGQKNKERVLAGGKWGMPCLAGGSIGVIEPDGLVRLCELKDPVGMLRRSGYDFMKIWRSDNAKVLRQKALARECSCTHVCFINMSAGGCFSSVAAMPWHALLAIIGF